MNHLTRHKSIVSFAIIFLFAILSSSTAEAQKTGKTVKNTKLGISFKFPKGWVSIPIDPLDQYTIHKYQAERPDEARKLRGYQQTSSMDVLYFPPLTTQTGENAAPDEAKGMLPTITIKNYEDYIKKMLRRVKIQGKPKKKKINKIPATYYDFLSEQQFIGRDSVFLRVRSCVYHSKIGDIAFQFTVLDEHYKKRKSSFDSAIRSLKLIEKKDTQKRDAAMSQLSDNDRYIQEQIDKLSSGWYHFWSKKNNYMIFSNAEKSFARDIAKYLEGIRECYEKAFPGEPRIDWKPIVRVCRNKNEYHGYGGPSGSAGYWSDLTKEFVFYNDVARGSKNSIETLKHEAFHHYIHFYMGCRLSTWFDEGCAEYFSGGEFIGSSIKIKALPSSRGAIQHYMVKNAHVPLRKMLGMTQREFYAKAGICYPESWSFVYFLLQGRKKGANVEKEWTTIPKRYLENLKESFALLEKENPDDVAGKNEVNSELSPKAIKMAMDKTFEGWMDKDWERLEKAWIDYIK